MSFMASFYGHFNELPVHFVYDGSSGSHDYHLSALLLAFQARLDTKNPPLFYFLKPTDMAASEYEAWKVKDENVIVLVSVVDETQRRHLEHLATSGLMEKGIWAVPKGLIKENMALNRYDSNIYMYNLDEVGSFASLEEIFSIKKRHRFVNKWGNWTLENGLTLYVPHIWERRMKFLKGIQLKGVFMEWSPFTFISENGITYGIIPDVIKTFQVFLLENLEFRLEISTSLLFLG